MMTATLEQTKVSRASHNVQTPSDYEVARRVSEIRSRWSVKERVERRFEAIRRFDALLEAMTEVASPAA